LKVKDTYEDLAIRFIGGDEESFNAIYEKCESYVHNLILYKVDMNHEVAEDVFQDTMVKVYNAMKNGKYKPQAGVKLSAWIGRIAHNLCMDHHRAKIKTASNPNKVEPELLFLLTEGKRVRFDEDQSYDELRVMISMLPADQKLVITERCFNNKTFKDIAEKENVSINTALGRMRYALINLRKINSGDLTKIHSNQEGVTVEKRCRECNEEFPLEDFCEDIHDSDTYVHECKECFAKLMENVEQPEEVEEEVIDYKPNFEKEIVIMEQEKYCKRCDTKKSIDEFGKNRSTNDGKQFYCKKCMCKIVGSKKEEKLDADIQYQTCLTCGRKREMCLFDDKETTCALCKDKVNYQCCDGCQRKLNVALFNPNDSMCIECVKNLDELEKREGELIVQQEEFAEVDVRYGKYISVFNEIVEHEEEAEKQLRMAKRKKELLHLIIQDNGNNC